MSWRSPAGPLIHEHRIIERMVAVLQREQQTAVSRGRVDTVVIDAAVDFIRTYADRCHHGKEEDILFRRLAEKNLDSSLAEAMAGLIADHVYARTLTRELVDANGRYKQGDHDSLLQIESKVRALVEFYPVHIEKEDLHFFRPCLEYLSEAEQAEMLRDFDEFDRALIHRKYQTVVEELERTSA